MIRFWTAVLMTLLPVAAMAGVGQDRLAPCLAKVDAVFRAGAGQPFNDRWQALQTHAGVDSQCLATVTTHCAIDAAGPEACFDDLATYLQQELAAQVSGFPAALDAPAELAGAYAQWIVRLDGGALSQTAPCTLPPSFPANACPALQGGQALIEARHWARLMRELDSLR